MFNYRQGFSKRLPRRSGSEPETHGATDPDVVGVDPQNVEPVAKAAVEQRRAAELDFEGRPVVEEVVEGEFASEIGEAVLAEAVVPERHSLARIARPAAGADLEQVVDRERLRKGREEVDALGFIEVVSERKRRYGAEDLAARRQEDLGRLTPFAERELGTVWQHVGEHAALQCDGPDLLGVGCPAPDLGEAPFMSVGKPGVSGVVRQVRVAPDAQIHPAFLQSRQRFGR